MPVASKRGENRICCIEGRQPVAVARSLLLLFSCALALCALGAPLKEHRFSNGARLLVDEIPHEKRVAIEIWIRAGASAETSETNGAAHLLEHMIFKGAKRHPSGTLDRTLETKGAVLEASTERDWTRYSTTISSSHWEFALRLILDHVLEPLIPFDELERERQVVAQHEYALSDSDPVKRMRQSLYSEAFKETPYARPVLGDRTVLKSLNRETLFQFHRRHYLPANMVILLSGKADMARAQQVLKSVWESIGEAQENGASAPIVVPTNAGAHSLKKTPSLRLPLQAKGTDNSNSFLPSADEASAVHSLSLPPRSAPRKFTLRSRGMKGEPSPVVSSTVERLVWMTEKTGRYGFGGLGIRVPEASSAEAVLVGMILKEILCDPVHGVFFQKKQEERLFRSCTSDYLPRFTQGLITCVFDTEPQQLNVLEEELRANFIQLPDSLTLEQFQRAKQRLQIQQEWLRKDLTQWARQAALYECLELSDLSQNWQTELDKLTFEQFLRRMFPEVEPRAGLDVPIRTLPTPPKRSREPIPPQTRILANGMKLLAMPESNQEGISFHLFIRLGLTEEQDFSPGIGALFAELLFANSENETEGTMPYRIGQTTSRIEVIREADYLRIEIYTTEERVDNALSLLAEGVFRAKFDSASLNRARASLLYQMNYPKDQGYRQVRERVRKGLFNSHPLSSPLWGTPESIRSISLRELERFYKSFIRPQNVLLIAGGNLDPEGILEMARKRFESIESPGAKLAVDTTLPPAIATVNFVQSGSSPADYWAFGRYVRDWTSEEYAAALVLSALIGEGKGSALFQALRDQQGFGYEIGSFVGVWGGGLEWGAYLQFDSGISQEAKNTAEQRFKAIAPEPNDFERAKQIAIRRLNLERATLAQRLRRAGQWELLGKGYDLDEKLLKQIETLTWEGVIQKWEVNR